jgi:RNA-splicing ligase RtcB
VLPNGPVSQNTLTTRAHSRRRVAEEKPRANKDVAEVVEVVEAAGITRQVVRLRPFAVIKG